MYATEEPEVYVNALVASTARRGQNLGGSLIGVVKAHAQDNGIHLVRLDCYNGGDGQLRRWYEKMGFTPIGTYEESGWKGAVLEQRV